MSSNTTAIINTVSNAEIAENYFNVLSNFVCLLPTILFLHDRNYYDAIIVFGTGITSFLYHLNNNDPQLLDYFIFDQTGIQVADAILSDILVFQVSSYLAFYKNFMLRSSLLFMFLPFEIYMAVTSRGKFHLYVLFLLVGVFTVFVLRHLHKQNKIRSKYMVIFICGAIMNIVEIIMYADLQERYEHKYNVYHAIHHIMAFLSIVFYFFVPKNFIFQRPFLRNIRSYEDFGKVHTSDIPTIRDETEISVGRSYTPSSEARRFHMNHMHHEYNSSSDLYKPEYHHELTKRIKHIRDTHDDKYRTVTVDDADIENDDDSKNQLEIEERPSSAEFDASYDTRSGSVDDEIEDGKFTDAKYTSNQGHVDHEGHMNIRMSYLKVTTSSPRHNGIHSPSKRSVISP